MPYIPQGLASAMSSTHSIISSSLPLGERIQLSLDNSGALGLLGGANAVSAMIAVHVYENRHYLGWYNQPGSFQISARFATFTKSTSWRSIFGSDRHTADDSFSKGVYTDPATLLGMDNCRGPKFRAAHSGTVMEHTGFLAAFLMKECTARGCKGKVVPGRRTQPVEVTVVDLDQEPLYEMRPTSTSASTLLFSSIPIAISLGTCVLCTVFEDFYALALILLGIIASGLSSFVLGSGDLVFTHPQPAKGSPTGDGILGSDKDIVLLRGTEGAVNSITRGSFFLRFANNGHLYLLRWCSYLFFIQAIAQLFLIPQASLFGQVMFLASLGVSALYNAQLSSTDGENIHKKLLFKGVLNNPRLTKYTLGTRTTAVVFMLLVLQLQDPTGLLNELLPNDTKVWKQWKTTMLEKLRHPHDFQLGDKVGHLDGFTQEEKELLQVLYGDAQAACDGYRDYLQADSL